MHADGPGLSPEAVRLRDLRHRFGEREALAGITLDVPAGELLALLGPNGSGKTTLFRILSTSLLPGAGSATVFGADVVRDSARARRAMGVVFQAPSLDRKLTAAENLRHQGRLYGLRGRALEERIATALGRMGLADRAGERVERLSGGMARRVELAKGLLHRPRLLLLDEPTSGLDPAARREFWTYFDALRRESGATAVVTTHLMEEADRADRIALMDEGRLVALGPPAALTAEIGGDVITLETGRPEELAAAIAARLGCQAAVVERAVRIEIPRGHELVPRLMEAFGDDIRGLVLGKPTLDDVFVRRTGHHFHAGDAS
ncbi:MAG TPA: ATP-binding cassette domain-containing protein [Gemmatimonadales bacterium]|nr:ATP-binding cassette domain-containing protein [Gemmatimonadales bacterium]